MENNYNNNNNNNNKKFIKIMPTMMVTTIMMSSMKMEIKRNNIGDVLMNTVLVPKILQFVKSVKLLDATNAVLTFGRVLRITTTSQQLIFVKNASRIRMFILIPSLKRRMKFNLES